MLSTFWCQRDTLTIALTLLFHPVSSALVQEIHIVPAFKHREESKKKKFNILEWEKQREPYAKLVIFRNIHTKFLAIANLHNISCKVHYPGRKFGRTLGSVWHVIAPLVAKSNGDLRLERVSNETDGVREEELRHLEDRRPEEINRYTHTYSRPICCVWTPNTTSELAWKWRKHILSKSLCTVWAISVLYTVLVFSCKFFRLL